MIENSSFNPSLIAFDSTLNSTKRAPNAIALTEQFGSMLSDEIAKLQSQGVSIEQLTQQVSSGDLTDVHQLTIASQKLAIGLELTVQIRNKVIEAYQEIMRTQL